MRDTNRLALSVTHSDGRITRWGPDEPNATEIPDDLTFSTQVPGGFKDLTCSLLRRIDVDYPDLGLFDSVRVYGPGNRTVWEGRMAQFPRSHGDGFEIVPGAVGWSAHLTDDPSFREVYVDRDKGSWGDIPISRKLAGGAVSLGDFAWSGAGDALVIAFPSQALPSQTIAEIAYRDTPLQISDIYYKGANTSFPSGYIARITASDAESTTAETYTPTFDDTVRSQALSPVRRYLRIYVYSNGSATTPTAGAITRVTTIAVYGTHGLTKRTITSDAPGLYASDVIEDIVTRAAPLLSIGEIEATTYAIPHLVFAEPTTGETAIQLVNGYHGFDWGVYDNREFFYRASDSSRLTWQARLSDGARLELEGDTAEQIFNGVYVTYTDPSGQKKTVGPPGATADATDASLEDTSATNPLNAWGITRWGMLDISEVTTQAGAIQLGSIWLGQHAVPQRRGTLTLTGTATHPLEGEVPVWRVRAGDYVSIADHPADVPRRIIETRYSHGQRTIVLNLDNTPYVLDALLHRFGAGLVGDL